MTWQILLALSIITTVIYSLLQKVLIKHEASDPIVFSISSQLVPGIIIFFITLVTHSFSMPNLLAFTPNVLLMIFFYGFSVVFMFKSLKLIDASEFIILFVTRALWSLLVALIFLGEHFTNLQIIGTVFILISIIFVSYKKEKIKFGKGELYALLSAALFGLALGNDGYLIKHFDVMSYLVFAFILPGMMLMGVYPKKIKKLPGVFAPKIFWGMLCLWTCYILSAITFFQAFKIGNNVGQVSIINQISTVLIVLSAIVFLGEKKYLKRKIIGVIIAFIGVILLT